MMTTRSTTFFRNSLVLIDENDGRVLDVLTQHQADNQPGTVKAENLSPLESGSSHRPANWTSSDISLRTLNKDRPNDVPLSSIEGFPEDLKTSRFLNFRRNEDFARSLLARPGTAGRRRTTFYTDARTSVASFFTAYDDHGDTDGGDETQEDQAGPSERGCQAVAFTGDGDGFGKEKGNDNRSVIELFSIPHPDDVIPEPEEVEVDVEAPTSEKVAPETAYLDRFWATLFASPDKDKDKARSDGSWVVAVSYDMSKWFIDNLSTLINRTTSLLGPTIRDQDKHPEGQHGFPARPIREPTEEEYNSIPLSPTTMALRSLSIPERSSGGKDDGQSESRLGLWYIEDDGTSRQIWAGGDAGTGRDGVAPEMRATQKATS